MNVELTNGNWFKSSYSGGGEACVEVAFLTGSVGVRDSKNRTAPALVFTPAEWDAFTACVAGGVLNRSRR